MTPDNPTRAVNTLRHDYLVDNVLLTILALAGCLGIGGAMFWVGYDWAKATGRFSGYFTMLASMFIVLIGLVFIWKIWSAEK